MFTKRIIPCLDVKNGRVVKGVNFVNLQDAGDPVEIAAAYDAAGADELVFLDITASSDARNTVVDMVRRVAETVFIPFTVGGGIRTVEDFRTLLREGADKISINSAAIQNPSLIRWPFEKTVMLNQKAFLFRVHRQFSQIPEEIKEKAVPVAESSVDFILSCGNPA